MEAVEEQPREAVVGEGWESRGGDEGLPKLADGGCTEEKRDGKVREDEFGDVRAYGSKWL